MKARYFQFVDFIQKTDFIPLLAIRLLLAYEFYGPAMEKLNDFSGTVAWFTDMGIPLPGLNAFFATAAEVAAFVLLPVGLGTRLVSIPLIVTMIVAIVTVHAPNGFNVCDGGYKFPVYYIIMLVVLLTRGAGKASLDYWLDKRMRAVSER
ncbi:MAG TPA: DoxX family protein [Flavobacteriales bacterium]|nr:DoxX family protein [Flavobacteriales bacterium]